jgi:aminotransferase
MTDQSSRLLSALADRIHEQDVSYRTKMLEIAANYTDVIAMGRGDPDFHTPAHIVQAAKNAIDRDQTHYTHPAGMPQLRAAIAAMLGREYSLDYSAEEIIVTAGTQEAVMLCMTALIEPGDEVLMPSPRFTSYDTAVELFDGKCVSVPTYEKDDFALVPAEIEKRITPRSKIIVLITPNNPTGAVTPPSAVREIAEIAKRHDLIVLSDEIYAKIIFEGSEHLSIGSLPGMKERTITLNGFSKSYAMTGWRVGYMAAPQGFVRMLIEPRHTLSINAATPSQWAALAAIEGPQDESTRMFEEYRARRAYMMGALDELGLTYGHPGGAFYLYVNVEKSGLPAPVFCELLLREAQVLLFPGTLFGDADDRYVRMSLLQPIERMKEAMRRITAAKDRLFVSGRSEAR